MIMMLLEILRTESKQENELSPEELRRLKEKQAVIERLVFENYWKSIEELGRHVIARSVELIALEICKKYGLPYVVTWNFQLLLDLLELERCGVKFCLAFLTSFIISERPSSSTYGK